MPRPCSICIHKKQKLIEDAILAGKSLSQVAKRYRISEQALGRHKSHMASIVHAQAMTRSDDIFGQLSELRDRAETLWGDARAEGNLRVCVLVLRERIRLVEVLDRLLERARCDREKATETDLNKQLNLMTPEQLEALVTGSEWAKDSGKN